MWAGGLLGERQLGDGTVVNENALVSGLRLSVGGVFGSREGLNVRVGAAADGYLVTHKGAVGAAVGVEGQVDWCYDPRWRLGLRLSGSYGSPSEPWSKLGGQIFAAGVRARHRDIILGIDALFARDEESGRGALALSRGHSSGVLVGAGLTGRRGKYATATVLGVGAFVGIVTVVVSSLIFSRN